MLKSRLSILVVLVSILFWSCKSTKTLPEKPTPPETPQVVVIDTISEIEAVEETETEDMVETFNSAPVNVHEFRGAWVASVANINWPSKPALSVADQKKEITDWLNLLENLNFNAVILQIRPQADALYPSELEPWSYYLTGKSGKAPDPEYDPLKFWIQGAHDRGMELHVWLNPYRAFHTTAKEVGEESVIKKHPEWVVELKNGMWWMDPANKKVQDRASDVVIDIVSRYDIDAIHFDDYFYPYASYNGKKDFPDTRSWNAYVNSGGNLSRSDWRRKQVNDFIQRVSEEIRNEKAHVKFGISPFGIWRPNFPQGIKGMDQFEELYADAKLWLNKGWIDYFSPQLYWKTSSAGQSFPVLLGWWESENVVGRHLWPGINLGLEKEDTNRGEIVNQIQITRGILRDSPGVIHWDINQLKTNPELANRLKSGPYSRKVLVPETDWLSEERPQSPDLVFKETEGSVQLNWKESNSEIKNYVVYFHYEDQPWDYKILPSKTSNFAIPLENNSEKLSGFGVNAVGRNGMESSFREFSIND